MTNKEAIFKLIEYRRWLERNFERFDAEPFDMAIEALEREPCDDAISRQAVLDIRTIAPIALAANGEAVQYKEVVFVRDLEKLPSVTPQPITLEKAIDYLHEIGWMQEHDKEMAQPKVGEWLKNGELCKCSRCGSLVARSVIKSYNYCFQCGARMEVSE